MSIEDSFPMGNKIEVCTIREDDPSQIGSIKQYMANSIARELISKVRIKKEKRINGMEFSAKVYVFTENQLKSFVDSIGKVRKNIEKE